MHRFKITRRRLLELAASSFLVPAALRYSEAVPTRAASVREQRWTVDAAALRSGASSGLALAGDSLSLAENRPDGIWTSAPHPFGDRFTHLAVRWRSSEWDDSARLTLRVRTSPDGRSWSDWQALITAGHLPSAILDGGAASEPLVAQGAWTQLQVGLARSAAKERPAVAHLELIALDTSDGPSSADARRQARPSSRQPVGPVAKPPVIPRSGWGCPQPASSVAWPPEYAGVARAFVHHTVTQTNDPDPAGTVRAIWYYHAITLGWGDIGYNYLIDGSGSIYEGRFGGDNVTGGHAFCFNPGSAGIALLGDFRSDPVPPAARDALVQLLAWLCGDRPIHPLKTSFAVDRSLNNLCGHRDGNGACNINTTCPGDSLYNQLPDIRNRVWNSLPIYAETWGPHNTPATMMLGASYAVQIGASNRGRGTWDPNAPRPVNLGYRWFRPDGSNYVQSGGDALRTTLPGVVEMAGSFARSAQVAAPREGGDFFLHWDMVQELVTWFEQQGAAPLIVSVHVAGPLNRQALFPSVRSGR